MNSLDPTTASRQSSCPAASAYSTELALNEDLYRSCKTQTP